MRNNCYVGDWALGLPKTGFALAYDAGITPGGAHFCSIISAPGMYVRKTIRNAPALVVGSQLDSLSLPGESLWM